MGKIKNAEKINDERLISFIKKQVKIASETYEKNRKLIPAKIEEIIKNKRVEEKDIEFLNAIASSVNDAVSAFFNLTPIKQDITWSIGGRSEFEDGKIKINLKDVLEIEKSLIDVLIEEITHSYHVRLHNLDKNIVKIGKLFIDGKLSAEEYVKLRKILIGSTEIVANLTRLILGETKKLPCLSEENLKRWKECNAIINELNRYNPQILANLDIAILIEIIDCEASINAAMIAESIYNNAKSLKELCLKATNLMYLDPIKYEGIFSAYENSILNRF